MRITESKFRRIMAEEIRRLHEMPDMEEQIRKIAMTLDASLSKCLDDMSDLNISVEDACSKIRDIVEEFCKENESNEYEHQVTYGDEDEDSDDSDDAIYREYVDEFKAIIEAGEEPEDSNIFKTAVRDIGEEMARNALDDALAQTED